MLTLLTLCSHYFFFLFWRDIDLAELSSLPSTLELDFPSSTEIFQFNLSISPDDGSVF